MPTGNRASRTRTGAAWFGIRAAALLFVVLIVFMLQNNSSVRVGFLRMEGSLPLALALLIGAMGAALLTMVVGAARISQLRRQRPAPRDPRRPLTTHPQPTYFAGSLGQHIQG